jgi:hemoglobin/transferrin/lactoferrin receptor protein
MIQSKKKLMKHFLFIFMVMWAMAAQSQALTVLDEANGLPVEGAAILSNKPRTFEVTDSKGRAAVSAFKGSEQMQIQIIGYKTATKSWAELEADGFKVLLKRSNITLDVAVVSATRWNENHRDMPGRVTTLQAKEIALQNPQTAADLLNLSGEVFVQKSQQGGGSPMIRGFATNRLLYVIDGVRMNTAIFRSGNIQNVISLDAFATESAEVLFGPGSVIYGSDAIGGVMSFSTLTPRLSGDEKQTTSGEAVLRFSSANREQTGHFHANAGWKKFAFVTSFSHNSFGDLRMGSQGPEEYLDHFYVQRVNNVDVKVANPDPRVQRPTGYDQINLMQKFRWKPSDNWDVRYDFHYSETTDVPRYDRLTRVNPNNGNPRSAEWYYGPQEWMMNLLTVTNRNANPAYDQVTLRAAQQLFRESRHDRNFGNNRKRNRHEQVLANSVNLDFIKNYTARHTVYYGFEAVTNDVRSRGTDYFLAQDSTIVGPSRYPNSTWESMAAYANYRFKLNENFLLQGGLRWNSYSLEANFSNNLDFFPLPFERESVNKDAIIGSFGVVFRPNETWLISATGSTGFRAPNVDDMGKIFDSGVDFVVVPNPNLEAELAKNAELSIAKVFGDLLKLDATGYYTILENALVRRRFNLNGADSILYNEIMTEVQAIQNASRAEVMGFQAGMEVKLPEGFSIGSRFNWQKGEEEMDDGTVSPSRHVAPWFGVSRLNFERDRLRMRFSVMYSGGVSHENLNPEERDKPEIYATDADGNPYSPAWHTLNLHGDYRMNDHWTISAGVENLSDQRYRPYSSGIVAPGRNFILAARARF